MRTIHGDTYQYTTKLSVFSKKYSCEELKNIFGIDFDEAFNLGDAYKKTNIIYEENEVCIKYDGDYDDFTIDKYFISILNRIRGKEEIFQLNKGDCRYVFRFIVYSTTEPPLHFSSDILFQLGNFGIELDIDQYINKGDR